MCRHKCILNISNTDPNYTLTLQKISGADGHGKPCGKFSTSIKAGETSIPPGGSMNLTLTGGHLFSAGAILVWNIGKDKDVATIAMVFRNNLFGWGNKAELNVTGSPMAMLTYGVSYFYAAQGKGTVLSRDYINPLNDKKKATPVTINFTIANNCLAGKTSEYLLPGIKHVVMLMLENRGFDHLMGQLYTENNGPKTFYPTTNQKPFNGVGAHPTFTNTDDNGNVVLISPVNPNVFDTPDPDPGEGYANTNQQLFNNTDKNPSGKPNMGGFLNNYIAQKAEDPEQIMKFYTPEHLRVISGLAKHYSISDAWHCSVPSQTFTNRAFSVAGTASGIVENSSITLTSRFKMNTIFNVLTNCGLGGNMNWSLYYQDGAFGECATPLLFEQLEKLKDKQPGNVQSIDQFFDTISNGGDLPAFSYMEPAWNFTIDGIEFANGNDYHPPANLCSGEVMLLKVYTALTKYKDWDKTLFIVTFDEHGGNFDHVIPPDTIQPDAMNVAGFDFTRLGIRVPTLLISPRIQNGMLFRPEDKSQHFDHTSFLKTILGWQGIDISGGVLGARAAVAPDFSGVLSATPVNTELPSLAPAPECLSDKNYKNKEVKLNPFQHWLFPSLAYSIVGGTHGSAEHRRVLSELRSLETNAQLREYIDKERAKRVKK